MYTAKDLAQASANTTGGSFTYTLEELEALAEGALKVVEGGVMVEIGCYAGRSSSILLQVAAIKKCTVHLIDPFKWMDNYGEIPRILEEETMRDFPGHITHLHKVSSDEAHKMLKLPKIDFIHIDGDHSERLLRLDCDLWLPLLTSGGCAAFHDYEDHHKDNVVKIVDELTGSWELVAHKGRAIVKRKP